MAEWVLLAPQGALYVMMRRFRPAGHFLIFTQHFEIFTHLCHNSCSKSHNMIIVIQSNLGQLKDHSVKPLGETTQRYPLTVRPLIKTIRRDHTSCYIHSVAGHSQPEQNVSLHDQATLHFSPERQKLSGLLAQLNQETNNQTNNAHSERTLKDHSKITQ